MSTPYALGYVVVHTARESVSAWRSFATDGLGLMAGESVDDDVLRLRMDERSCRVAVVPSAEETFFLGWEYRNRKDFENAATALGRAGVDLEELEASELSVRGVAAAMRFVDPAGAHGEIFYGPDVDPITHFVSPQGVTFVTGDGGAGHAVLLVKEFESTIAFYQDVLGFQLRDEKPGQLAFLGCNPREHSLAMGHVPDFGTAALMHIMFETATLDDVGRAMDRMLEGAGELTVSLGKHWNDHMISFYVRSPSGFDVEYGSGAARVCTDQVSHVRQNGHGGASFWGHRVILPDGSLGPNLGKAIEAPA